LSFQASLFFYLLFKNRKITLYTRDPGFILFRLIGFKVAFECHLIPKNRDAFFSLVKYATRVIVISKALKDAFIAAGFAPKKILVAPSGVDLSTFDIAMAKEDARKGLDLPQNKFIAMYTGNFTTMGEDKGISDILKALPNAPEVLFVAVGGSEKDVARYRKGAEMQGLSERVILRGSTTQKQLAIYQKAADVLLMPFPDTPHYRNHMSPVKMFEYMAAKRPIIASDLPTIKEVLNNANAVIIPPGNVEALLQALALSIPADLSEKAYADVQEYTWKRRAERVTSFIS
jgi:glycosyltransferase involved in cell wall biosynthesis